MINLNNPIQTHKQMSAILIENNTSNSVRKKTLSQKVEVGINLLIFMIIVIVAIISLIFLAHANKNATKGYALKNLEKQRTNLVTENEVWDMEIANVKSLENLLNDPKILSMRKADQPRFMRGDTAIASR